MSSFGARLRQASAAHGRLCVGIDPHPGLLTAWGLDVSADGARRFGLAVVRAAASRVGVVKPQVAFFERYGSAGFAALEEVIGSARAAGLIVIADAKRGDIGSTMQGYAEAWLAPGAALEADALTVSPYLGVGALADTARFALAHGKGLFVLAATSNPEAAGLQRAATATGVPVAAQVCAQVRALDVDGSLGVVIGATCDRDAFGLSDAALTGLPVLAPGFGHQGAALSDLGRLFGPAAPEVLASASRSILSAGPDGLAEAIETHQSELEA
ncbi:orotidine-5'-phosphate decarboxylase [Microbacterium luticocti]|uniref:orotidine-5'-phosphate decarboxylase n=1 Tax=Microbacterium luticocti TaxID=451764 RepID=UPI0004293ED4|nr:orotidine-5'-phosphate decarboxylase [Microbacterium luticocti]